MQQSSREPEGTMMYVTATGSLFLKVSQGWKEIQVVKPACNQQSSTRSSCPALICLVPQLGSLVYASSNIIPQDEVNLAEFEKSARRTGDLPLTSDFSLKLLIRSKERPWKGSVHPLGG